MEEGEKKQNTLPSDWIFSDPLNTLVFLSPEVDSGAEKITFVSHDSDDGVWQFLGDSMGRSGNAVLCCLSHPVKSDATLKELADLPFGWFAERDGPEEPWKRYRKKHSKLRRFLSAVPFLFGLLLASWVIYNLFVERLPEAKGSPSPAIAFASYLIVAGWKGVRGY